MVSNRGPSAYQPNALPLGQTGSHLVGCTYAHLDNVSLDKLKTIYPAEKVQSGHYGKKALVHTLCFENKASLLQVTRKEGNYLLPKCCTA